LWAWGEDKSHAKEKRSERGLEMSDEDKMLIAEYMKWKYWFGGPGQCYRISEDGGSVNANFDSNDAFLCVQEMWKRGEWQNFLFFVGSAMYAESKGLLSNFVILLFDPNNFFTAMAAWIKEVKND
jgi:hypothetical protein